MPLFSPHRSRAKCDDRLTPACCVRCVHNGIFTHLEQLSTNFAQPKKKPAEPIHMGICGLLEGEPTTRLELVTYRLRIKEWYLIINNLQKRCAVVALQVSHGPKKQQLSYLSFADNPGAFALKSSGLNFRFELPLHILAVASAGLGKFVDMPPALALQVFDVFDF